VISLAAPDPAQVFACAMYRGLDRAGFLSTRRHFLYGHFSYSAKIVLALQGWKRLNGPSTSSAVSHRADQGRGNERSSSSGPKRRSSATLENQVARHANEKGRIVRVASIVRRAQQGDKQSCATSSAELADRSCAGNCNTNPCARRRWLKVGMLTFYLSLPLGGRKRYGHRKKGRIPSRSRLTMDRCLD